MADPPKERRAALFLVVGAAVLWSAGGVGVKLASAEPLVIAGMRSGFAFLFMAVVLAFRLRREKAPLGPLLRRPWLLAAAVSYAVMVVTFVLATKKTTAANAIFLQYTAPILVVVFAGPLLGEKPRARDALAVGMALSGMAMAVGGELGGGRAAGNAIAIVSAFGFGGLPLCLRRDRLVHRESAQASALASLVAIVLGNALGFIVSIPALLVHPPPLGSVALVGGLGVFQIGLPYVLYASAVGRLRAFESSLLATVEPLLSPVWVLLATGERPSPIAIGGGFLIVTAVATQAISPSKPVAMES